MLIALGGLPGAGKTTIAEALARRLGAVYLRIDSIEDALRASGSLGPDIGPAGYVVAYRVAEDNLRVGRSVVADCVNPLRTTREAWRSTARNAASRLAEVEIVCSDAGEHRRRVEARRSELADPALPTWHDVLSRRYEGWDRPRIVIDTANRSIEQSVAEVLVRIGAAP